MKRKPPGKRWICAMPPLGWEPPTWKANTTPEKIGTTPEPPRERQAESVERIERFRATRVALMLKKQGLLY